MILNRKNKEQRGFSSIYLQASLAMLITLSAWRLYQYFAAGAKIAFSGSLAWPEVAGFFLDFFCWTLISLVVAGPAWLASRSGAKAGKFILGFAGVVFLISEALLFKYFLVAGIPLDDVFLSYSVGEMVMIAGNSAPVGFTDFIPMASAVLAFLALMGFLQVPRQAAAAIWIVMVILSATARTGMEFIPWKETDRTAIHAAASKTDYLVARCIEGYSKRIPDPGMEEVNSAARRYQAAHPGFSFPGLQYPFLRKDDTPDVLSPFFNLGKEKPNLVIVIVESLTTAFIGNNPYFGSFTPFLDSLAGRSLFWINFLSASDRTFRVLPALLGSLPPGDPAVMTDIGRIPYHLSLVNCLKENGYWSGFYYGGDPSFNAMEVFLRHQGTDYIHCHFRSADPSFGLQGNIAGWGLDDESLYRDSFRVIDSIGVSPRLDIYLTLSLHSPFRPPRREHYLAEVERRSRVPDRGVKFTGDPEKQPDIFATILYTDDALRGFFEKWRRRPDFGNTIFIITGDHGLPELALHRISPLHRFNVPLIIYSPMLKTSRLFMSVSSHLDVTPSLMAMLRKQYGFLTRTVTPWIGSGLDTVQRARNVKDLAFIYNNRQIIDILDHDYFYDSRYLYRYDHDFWLREVLDKRKVKELEQKLADFRTLSSYVSRQNRLIPREVFYRKVPDSLSIPLPGLITMDSTDAFSAFRTLLDRHPLPANLKYLELDLRVEALRGKGQQGKDPVVVFDLYDGHGRQLIWNSFALKGLQNQGEGPGRWIEASVHETIRLDQLQGKDGFSLMLYVWNPSGAPVRFRDPELSMTGFY